MPVLRVRQTELTVVLGCVRGAGMSGEKRAPTSHQLNFYHIA